ENTIVPQLLSEIDGVEGLENVIVIGASNREDMIDPAILRPGRLDVKIKIERPDAEAARDIFAKYITDDLPLHDEDLAEHGGSRSATVEAMIQRFVERMYTEDEENRFLEVTYANGDKEVLYFKDFNSGAMIENIVSRAKKMAIKDFIDNQAKGLRVSHLLQACVDEFSENEDLPNTTNPDDWARISGKKGERIVYIRTLVSTGPGDDGAVASARAGDAIDGGTGQYLQRKRRLTGMQRIIGTEVEYGISSPGAPAANPIVTSTQAVLAYAAAAGVPSRQRIRWDYEPESPLRDARGFDLSTPGPAPVIDADELGAANMILVNGARL